ncbi:MAG: enoyl-CoA hydratase/isomerase family protein [Bacteroidota bacterium]|nr:enoyl-CoA hydratase/isomerase family protein [Bacteroidota bacterium]
MSEPAGMIHWEAQDSIGILTLDAPRGNFLSDPEFIAPEQLKDLLDQDGAKALVICGAGKHFSGGARLDDLFKLAANPVHLAERMNKGKSLLDFIENLDIPVIAVINGICFGGGLEIALACHIRICSEKALFAFPECNHSLMPGMGGTIRLPGKISWASSLETILGGDMLNAQEALNMKIVDEVLPQEAGMEKALLLAKKMTKDRPRKVIRYILQALRNYKSMPLAEAMKEETRMFCELAYEEMERRKNENLL